MASPTTTDTATRAAASPTVTRVTSPGGLEAWLVEEHAVPLVALEFAFLGGASQDPAGRPGVANLLSGLLDEGAGPHDSDAFQNLLADRAIELRFYADRDTLRGSLKALTTHLPAAIDLLRLAVNEARLDADAVARVRGQVEAGLRHELYNPDSLAGRAFFANAFPGHPYGRPTRGTIESVGAITRDDLAAYGAQALARDNLRVAAVGAISADTLAQVLDDVFGPLPAAARLTPVADVTAASPGGRQVIDVDVPQSVVRFGGRGLKRLDADYLPGYVMNHILGGGVFSARLFREVREKRGLAYGVSSSLVPMRHSALFLGGTATKNERVAESLEVIAAEIGKLAADGPDAEELRLAKQYLIGSYALHFDTSTKIAGQLLQIAVEGLGMDYIDRRNDLIEAITAEDVRRAGTRFLAPNELIVVVAGRPVGV
ncbi:M16 family metallopeptidase [Chelatococcus reniformis]|uniref:Peptidase M16 n=1 Tax=Chelatococcus reniformis TaxID=1494448 RepID=A0A916XFS3_9HYPH|nr:pitrilysin family protein [Chelatococcus reniformis]GGC67363.1 peptidase M16 [Chelatococcus reniformis]